jgi:hypothetical protein
MINLSHAKYTDLGGGRRLINSKLAPMRYSDGNNWFDVNPHFVRQGNLWVVEGAPYDMEIDRYGNRTIWPDRFDRSKYVYLEAPDFLRNLDSEVFANQIVMGTSDFEAKYFLGPAGVTFKFDVMAPIDLTRITMNVNPVGLDIPALLAMGGEVGMHNATIETPQGELVRPWVYSALNSQMELDIDVGDVFTLHNASIDVDVAADTDDVWEDKETTVVTDNSELYFRNTSSDNTIVFLRFEAAIPQGDTVDTCYILLYVSQTGNMAHTFRFEEAATPATSDLSNGDVSGRDASEAGDAWAEAWGSSGVWEGSDQDFTSSLQEVVTAFTTTYVAAIAPPTTDDAGEQVRCRDHAYSSAAYAPNLIVATSAGAGAAVTQSMDYHLMGVR